MGEKLDFIDLNSEAVEAADPSANETLIENRNASGVDGGPTVDGSRVLGEVKGYGCGASEGLGAEMEDLKGEIDLEKGENGSVGHEMMVNSDRFVLGFDVDRMEKKAGSVSMRGERENEVAQAPGMHSVNIPLEVVRDKMGAYEGKIKSEERRININEFVSGVKVDETENMADRVFVRHEKEDKVVQMPGMCFSNAMVDAWRDETDGTEGKIKSEESNLTGVFVHAGNVTKINLVVDLNARHGDGNGIGNEETDVKEVWGVSNVSLLDGGVNNVVSDNNGAGPNENQDAIVKEQMTEVRLEYVDGNDLRVAALRPKVRGEECQTEKEGEYYLSDIVWSRVRSHRWWPGQIFEPSAASEEAIKHFKKDSYLIAYFGDQTFTWTEAAKLKPFRMHFTQLEKQSNSIAFCQAIDCALAEVSRRIEFGLSCSCLPVEQRAKIKSQNVVNYGIREESSKRDGGDSISSAATFLPAEVFQHLRSLAVAPHSGIGTLRFVTGRAQLLAFNRWKSYCHLPEVSELDALLEKVVGIPASGEEDLHEVTDDKVQGYRADGEVSSGIAKSAIQDSSSWKRKHESEDDEGRKKVRFMTDIVAGSSTVVENGENIFKKKRGRKKGSLSSSKKYEAAEVISGDSNLRRRKRFLSPRIQKESRSRPQKFTKVGKGVRRAASEVGGTTSALEYGQISSKSVGGFDGQNLVDVGYGVSSKAKREKWIPADVPSPEEMLSKLCLAASDPMKGYRSLYSFLSWFSNFRNSMCLQNINAQNHEKSPEQYKEGNTSTYGTTEAFEFQGIEDSYWTDRIIQSNPEEPLLFEPENAPEETAPVVEPGNVVSGGPYLDHKQGGYAAGDLELEAENPAVIANDNSEEYSSTTLTLRFSDLESVPSVTDLNKVFSRYGPLDGSLTKVFSKSKRAKVVFERRADAETAFSSAGKYSIFGPSLLSYSLKPTPSRASAAPKRSGNGAKSAKGKLQFEC